MSYKALHWAWNVPVATTEKFVLVALADMADEEHSCFPGQAMLAGMVGASERTIRRALATLEEEELLTREERRKPGGYKTSDRYFLQVGAVAKSHRSDCPVGDSHRTSGSISPDTDVVLTGQSDRYIEDEPPENHQGTTRGSRKRSTRIPEPFMVTAEMRAWAASEVPGVDVDAHTREFVDYWRGKSGKDATKADWPATWRNWMRKASRWSQPAKATPNQKAQTALDIARRLGARANSTEQKEIAS